MSAPVILKFGIGVESSGVACGWRERGFRPDAVVAADTGNEKPETYVHGEKMDRLMQSWGWDPIVWLRDKKTLEQHSLDTHRMPSVSYGRKSCSVRFKTQPFEKWLRRWEPARDAWKRKEKVVVVIGYNVDERTRWMKAPTRMVDRIEYRYDLVNWKWGREDAADACRRFGLNPCKSACFFCGSARIAEVRELRRTHPDLAARGVAMERNARPFRGSIRGLGKNFSWEELFDADDRQMKFWVPDEPHEIDCECHEGGDGGEGD